MSARTITITNGVKMFTVDFVMSDGDTVKVVCLSDDEGVETWVSEAQSFDEVTEDFALSLAKALHESLTNEVTA